MTGRNIASEIVAAQYNKEGQYWLKKLSGELEKSCFPFDFLDTGKSNLQPGTAIFSVPPEVSARLLKISNQSDQRLHMILVAAMSALLYQYTGSSDIILGSTIYKQQVNAEFINTVLALRTRVPGNGTFKDLLYQVKQTIVEAVENQNYPVETLVYRLGMTFSPSHFPLFDTALLLENIQDKGFIDHIKLKMRFIFRRRNNEDIEGEVEYDAALYRESTVDRIVKHYINLLEAVLNDVTREISRIKILSPDEKHQLLVEFNRTETPYPFDRTLHGLVEEQERRSPHCTALVCANRQLTYEVLNRRANQLARVLRDKGVEPDQIVGIAAERSLEMVLGILAILKAGGAYLPISTVYPESRRHYLGKDSTISLVLTKYNQAETPDFANEGVVAIDMNDPLLFRGSGHNPTPVNKSRDLAYLIYTSGSTGNPKGVLVEHSSALNVVSWFGSQYHLHGGTHVLFMSEYTFDASVNQLFATLIHGATLFIIDKERLINVRALGQYIDAHRINTLNFVPHLLKELLCQEYRFKSVQCVISGADKLEDAVKNEIIEKGYTLYNHYGPTEVTIDVLAARCSTEKVTLGKPIANLSCYILDRHNRLSPIGVGGELWVSGAGLARGYLNDPRLTKQRFTDNPFANNRLMYRTGDRMRWRPDGNIEFLGRLDQQVKIRGYRVELGEIENRLLHYEAISDAVVRVSSSQSGDHYLCAYYTSPGNPGTVELREYLAASLPEYMIPSYFVQLEYIPLTANGKVDRKQLPEIEDLRSLLGTSYVAPETALEKQVAEIWKQVLNLEEIGVNDNFFEIGGNSLKIIQVTKSLEEILHKEVSVAVMFRFPTIRTLAEYFSGEKTGTTGTNTGQMVPGKMDRLQGTIQKLKRIETR